MVPTGVISLILIGYVLMIGPVDYFVLGWLQMRKYTWIVFPVVTACFTYLTIAVAHAYMSSDATGSRMVITDLDTDNTPIRQTTLETLFYNRQDEVTQNHRRGLCVQMDTAFKENAYGQPALPDDKPLTYLGNFPQAYTTIQAVQQWSPVTLRSMTLEPDLVDIPKVDWDAVSLTASGDRWSKLIAALNQMSSAGEGHYAAYVVHGGVSQILFRGPGLQGNQTNAQFNAQTSDQIRSMESEMGLLGVAQKIPTQNMSSKGIFGIVSQLSPQGSTFLEDLSISDGTNPDEHVLVITRIRQGLIEVFRRRYFLKADVGAEAGAVQATPVSGQ